LVHDHQRDQHERYAEGWHQCALRVSERRCQPRQPVRSSRLRVFDRVENLTHADTLSVLTTCHNAFGPGGSEGYLVVSAEDPTKFATAWSWNYLIGSALVVNATGIVYAVNAIPFESPVAEGQPTDLNSNRQLDFDDKEYEGVPDVLMIDSFVALANSSLALLNLTGGKHDTNFLMFYVWNDNEFPLSTTLQFVCWFDQPLSVISQLFSAAFLARLKNDPAELDLNCDGKGDLETGWAMIDSLSVRQPGGNLVANDGAFLGSITAGQTAVIDGGRLLWESKATQDNGTFFAK
jgi:hypothetical protein